MTAARKRLVLVDDAEDNLEVFRIILEEEYSVTACRSCADAFVALRAADADLLLMDIAMSGVDGITCLANIRAIAKFRNIPAIAITAYANDHDRQRILASGFAAYIPKPVLDHALLRRIINQVIDGTVGQSAER